MTRSHSYTEAMDNETLSYIKERVAAEAQLPDGWSERLHGGTLTELRDDARKLAQTLGVAEPEPAHARDEGGRFAAGNAGMNEAIRAARGTVVPAAMREPEPDGTLGAGRAAVTNPPRRADMSDLIREASGR